jgi:hypothetical protein
MEDLRVAFDLRDIETMVNREPKIKKSQKPTSFIARKNASIRPPDNPLSGEVCNKTVPSTTDAQYATLKVTTVSIAASTRSNL